MSFRKSFCPSIFVSLCGNPSFFRSISFCFLSLKPPCRVRNDYYVNECDWRAGRRDRGVRHTERGVLLFFFSLSLSIVPRITAISTPEEYFNIRYSNTYSVIPPRPSSQHLITYTPIHPSIHPPIHPAIHSPHPPSALLPAVQTTETNVERE